MCNLEFIGSIGYIQSQYFSQESLRLYFIISSRASLCLFLTLCPTEYLLNVH